MRSSIKAGESSRSSHCPRISRADWLVSVGVLSDELGDTPSMADLTKRAGHSLKILTQQNVLTWDGHTGDGVNVQNLCSGEFSIVFRIR